MAILLYGVGPKVYLHSTQFSMNTHINWVRGNNYKYVAEVGPYSFSTSDHTNSYSHKDRAVTNLDTSPLPLNRRVAGQLSPLPGEVNQRMDIHYKVESGACGQQTATRSFNATRRGRLTTPCRTLQ